MLERVIGNFLITPIGGSSGVTSMSDVQASQLALWFDAVVGVGYGGARATNGSTQSAGTDDSATHSTGDVDFIFGGWFYPGDTTGVQILCGQWDEGTNQRGYVLWLNSAVVTFSVSNDGTAEVNLTSPVAAAASTWIQVVGAHDKTRNELVLWVNGIETRVAHATGIHDATVGFRIAADLNSGAPANFFNGRAANIFTAKPPALWAANDLSAQEIVDLLWDTGRSSSFDDLTSTQKTAIGLTPGNGSWYDSNEDPTTDQRMIDRVNSKETSRGFDGVNDRAEIADAAQTGLDLTANVGTFATWFKKTALGVSAYLVNKGGGLGAGNPGYSINITAGNLIKFDIRDDSDNTEAQASATAIPDTGWHHIAVVFDGTNAKFYLDGAYLTSEDKDISLLTGSLANAAAFVLGGYGVADVWDGRLQDPALWSIALTAANITTLYAGGDPDAVDWSTTLTTGRISHWPCNEGVQGAAILDADGNNDLPNVGSIQVTPGVGSTHAVPADGAAPTAAAGPGAGFVRSFDGTNDGLLIPFNARLVPGTGNFTIEAQITVDDHGANNGIWKQVETGGGANSIINFLTNVTTQKLRLNLVDSAGNSQAFETTDTVTTGTSHHVAAVVNRAAGTVSLYLDGELNGGVQAITAFGVGASISTDSGTYIGQNETPTQFFDGTIGRLRYYSATRTPDQIRILANGGEGMVFDDLDATQQADCEIALDGDEAGGAMLDRVTPVSVARGFSASGSDRLYHADHADLRGGNRDWSLCLWINTTNFAVHRVVASKDMLSVNRDWLVYIAQTTGIVNFFVFDGAVPVKNMTHSVPIVAGAWTFLAVRHTASTKVIGISIDGGPFEDAAAYVGTAGDSAAEFTLGDYGGGIGSTPFFGSMQGVIWYQGRALTDADVLEAFNGNDPQDFEDMSAGLKVNAKAAFDLHENFNGAPAIDTSGNGHHLTNNGTVFVANGVGDTVNAVAASAVATPTSALGPEEPGDGTAVDGGPVTIWQARPESTAGAREFFQQTASKKPTHRAADAAFNSKPVNELDGLDDLLNFLSTNLLTSNAGSIVAVVSTSDATQADQTVFGVSNDIGDDRFLAAKLRANAAANIEYAFNDGTTEDRLRGNTAIVTDTVYVVAFVWTGTTVSMYVNGTLQSVTVVSGGNNGKGWNDIPVSIDNWTIGAVIGTAAAKFLTGKIAEVGVWTNNLTAGEVADLSTALATKYAL